MRYRHVGLAVVAVLGLGGCVDQDVVGSYHNRDAGTLGLSYDGDGSYTFNIDQARVVPDGQVEPLGIGTGNEETQRWHNIHFYWDSDAGTVTIEPDGGSPVRLQRVDDTLILPAGPDGQEWTFTRWGQSGETGDPGSGG